MDRRRIESDLRYAIDERFKRHKVVIAFPQQDVHLSSADPLPIRMVP
ncbi:MAG: hypothetical protein ACYTF0_06175 [Planctomycetota bacterium]|jgi:small-conductance mechanosensitive channel